MIKSINISDIIYIEAEGPYSEINLVNGEIIVICKTLKRLDRGLSGYGFIRINRRIIINITHIIQINKPKFVVKLTGDFSFIISKRYKSRFLFFLQKWMLKI